MISHAGMPEAFSSGTVKVMGMVIRVVFMGLVKNLCSERRVTRRGEGCKSVEGRRLLRSITATDRISLAP